MSNKQNDVYYEQKREMEMEKEYKAQVNLNLPTAMLAKIDERAKKKGLTRTAVITQLLVDSLGKV